MKSTKLTFLLALSCFLFNVASAQTSDLGFSFQGYAIDPDGKSIGSEGITVKFTLTPGTFTEEHVVTTDAFGVFHAVIGNSSVANKAEFAKLDFTTKSTFYSLQVEVKKTAGGSYTTVSNAPLLAVPYARVAANGVPVGTIVAYAGESNSIPEGWILCDGASVLKTDYPQLYAAIGNGWGTAGGSFNIPDLQGRFLRGVGGGARNPDAAGRTVSNAGGNTGDNVGTVQDGVNKSHNHVATNSAVGNHTHNNGGEYVFANGTATASSTDNSGGETNLHSRIGHSAAGGHNHTITVNSDGGNEARPVNASVFYIIKY